MLIDALQTYYHYNRVTTDRVLDTAEKLTQDQWLAPQTAGRGSIRVGRACSTAGGTSSGSHP